MSVVRNCLVLVAVSLLLVGCAESPETDTAPVAEESHSTPKPELALCTGGNVPPGATNCLLDLGSGADSYWSDTDGVDPGTAGCHDEYMSDTCEEVKPGREFGEFCLDEDRLVESNPGANECHTHGGDLGKPDVVSCSEWCGEQGATGGRCEGGVVAQGAAGDCESARCVCA